MSIYFGGLHLPEEAATSHFAIVGGTGSGKTLNLRMMMGSVLPNLCRRPDQRAVVFDVKQEVYGILRGIGIPAERISILNPFDRRCVAWSLADDITAPDTSLQMAATLIPEEEGSQNRYFADAARDLVAGVINTFNVTAPGRWTFRDLVFALRNPALLQHVLLHTDDGADLAALHLDGGNTSRSVISTARSKLAPFEVIAALWHQAELAGHRISLRSFLKENRILVLGNNQAAITPIQAINRVLFQRLTELVLDQPESDTRRIWFFLDEVRKLGKLQGLDDLMTVGRSKGGAVVLGFQDLSGLYHVYGKELAEELIAMCGSLGILRVGGATTPRWASEVFGDQEIRQSTRSVAEGQSAGQHFSSSSTETRSEVIRERKLFLASQFRMIPRPERGKPLCGYFTSAFIGENRPYYARIPASEVEALLHPKAGGEVDFLPWPSESYKHLPRWTDADFARLGLRVFDGGAPSGGGSGPRPPSGLVDPFAGPGSYEL